MTVKVLVVDDSGFFRRRLTEILSSDSDIEVVGTAENGREAIEKTLALRPDVITMDYEMPVMDGITAVKNIMQRCPTAVLMFSSMTHEGARITLDALDAGALDYLPKNFEDISRNPQRVKQMLCDKVHVLARSNTRTLSRSSAASVAEPQAPTASSATTFARNQTERPVVTPPAARARRAPVALETRSSASASASASASTTATAPAVRNLLGTSDDSVLASTESPERKAYKLVAIGTSTGGPVALQRVLTQLPASFPAPIVIVQHMPAAFTNAFAERLNKLCKIEVKQAEEGDTLRPGLALLAPGGKQMMIDARGFVRILPGDERLNYKPSVDITFGSAAKVFTNKVLAVVLTGMGADGREGARLLKQMGSQVWAQDEASCVIYGMPMAIVKAGLADFVYSLDDISGFLVEACS